MTPSSVVTKIFVLMFGLAYPSYCSYKAIHEQDPRKYAQWLIYWIVFSLFLSLERFFDHFVVWIPFYYEIKIIVILWLVSPATKGSTLFYSKLLHPFLIKREQEIDSLIVAFNSLGYSTLKNIFRHLLNFVLAFYGQIQYGVIEIIKQRYNLQEVKEAVPMEKKQDPACGEGISTKNDTLLDLKEQQPSNIKHHQPSQVTSIKTPRSTIKKSTSPSSLKSSKVASPIQASKGRAFVPEPGSYFDRYLKPKLKTSPANKS